MPTESDRKSPFMIKLIASLCFIAICFNSVWAISTTFLLQNGATGVSGGIYSGAEDTYLRQAYPEVTPGAHADLYIGFESYNGGGKLRPMIRYDLSDFKSGWSSSARITGARLRVYYAINTGSAFTNKIVNVYRVSSVNAAWNAGLITSRTESSLGSACWKWRAYDNTNYAPDDPTNCPNSGAGCPRRNPWKGDSVAYRASWPALTSFTPNGCGVSGTDFMATPVASDTVSSSEAGTWLTFTFKDVSFVADWINNVNTNSGLILICPELETGSMAGYSNLRFPSCENAGIASRPILELDIEGYQVSGGFQYSISRPSTVSISIFNAAGTEVKKIAVGAKRNAGTQAEFWNCKSDSINFGDTVATVPDGQYTIKILKHQGLTAEYMNTLGISVPHWEGWPGNSAGNPRSICLKDSTEVFLPGKGFWWGEGCITGVRMKPDGTRLTYYADGIYDQVGTLGDFYAHASAFDNGKLYLLGDIAVQVYADPTLKTGGTVTKFNHIAIGATAAAKHELSVLSSDFAVYNGKMVVSSEDLRKIWWQNAATGALIQEVPVSGIPYGVAIDNAGRALVIVDGSKIVAFTEGNTAPATVIASGLDGAYRLDVNRKNGDIYVAEGGIVFNVLGDKFVPPAYRATPWNWNGVHPFDSTGQQVKRFTSTGTLIATFGIKGGRPAYGRYTPTDFRCLVDIAVAPDGSFWISEDGTWTGMTLPRRVGHFNADGALIKDFFGGMPYAALAKPDPDDPAIVWLPVSYGLIRTRVNWADKSWNVLGNYKCNFPPLFYGNSHTNYFQNASVIKHNGKTYFHADGCILYYDETLDKVYPVAFAGTTRSMTMQAQYLNGPDSLRIADQAWSVVNTYGGGLPWGASGNNTSWYDKNGDGDFRQSNEWAFATNLKVKYISASASSIMGRDGTLYGDLRATPTWQSVGGIDMPSYDFNQTSWLSAYLDSAFGATPPADLERPLKGLDSSRVVPGHSMWIHSEDLTFPMLRYYMPGLSGMTIDDSGNATSLYCGYWRYGDSAYAAQRPGVKTAHEIRQITMQNLLYKTDRSGRVVWSIRIPFASGYIPNAGQLSHTPDFWGNEGSRFQSAAGSVKNCFVGIDVAPSVNYVWDQDGLWVGNMFEKKHVNSAGLPAETWRTCGEQFGGLVYEVKTDTVPGLRKGDVLFFAAGQNDIPVYRISGFDQFERQTITLTVQNGQITGTSARPISQQNALLRAGLTASMQNGRSRITYTIGSRTPVTMEIYSMLGRKVATLVDKTQEAGIYTVSLDNMTSERGMVQNGLYVIRLKTGETAITKQLLRVR